MCASLIRPDFIVKYYKIVEKGHPSYKDTFSLQKGYYGRQYFRSFLL